MMDIILLQAAFGVCTPLSKWILFSAQPYFFAAVRLLCQSLFMLIFRRTCALPFKGDWHILMLYVRMIVIGVYIKYGFKYWSLQYISTARVALLFNTAPCIAAIMEYCLEGHQYSLRQLCVLVFVSIGALSLIMCNETAYFQCYLAELVLVAAIMAHCYGMICTRRLICRYGQSATELLSAQYMAAGLLCMTTSYIIEAPIARMNYYNFIVGISMLLGLRVFVCQYLQVRVIQRYSVTLVALSDMLGSVFSMLYAYFFLGEHITGLQVMCSFIIVIALYGFYQEEAVTAY